MDSDLEKFVAKFEAAGHVARRDAGGDAIADVDYDEDGCLTSHPMVCCTRCCYAVCWMCIECGHETIEPCEVKSEEEHALRRTD